MTVGAVKAGVRRSRAFREPYWPGGVRVAKGEAD